MCEDRSVVLRLLRAVRRDGQLGPGLVDLTAETARRLRAVAFQRGADHVEVPVAPDLAAAADLDQLLAAVSAATGVPAQVRDDATQRTWLTAAVAEDLGVCHPGPSLLVEEHRLEVVDDDGSSRWRAPGGVADLVPASADPLHPASIPALRAATRRLVADLAPGNDPRVTVTGAAARSLGVALTARRFGTDGPHARGLDTSVVALEALERELLSTSAAQRLLLPGVDPADVDEVTTTLVVLREIVAHLGAARLVVAPVTALDGMLVARTVTATATSARERAVAAHRTPGRSAPRPWPAPCTTPWPPATSSRTRTVRCSPTRPRCWPSTAATAAAPTTGGAATPCCATGSPGSARRSSRSWPVSSGSRPVGSPDRTCRSSAGSPPPGVGSCAC